MSRFVQPGDIKLQNRPLSSEDGYRAMADIKAMARCRDEREL